MTIRDIKGISYLFSQITEPPLITVDLLEKAFPELILRIDFPKVMRWADLEIAFARPIRWIVALYGESVLQFTVGPISSGNVSMGHRQLDPNPIAITSASVYTDLLKKHHVLVDIDERYKEIERQLEEIEKTTSSQVVAKERVIPQILQLVEYPFLTVATFDKAFLKAPEEVLISEMVEHQKYFPIADKDGKLKNEFIITANTNPTDSIRRGNQKVISARLSDGVFLYEHDLKTELEAFNEKLKNVTFQKGLGTVYDKVERLKKHVDVLAKHFSFPQAAVSDAQVVATLCKADLVSEMVGEFPELQGQMGRIYAMKQGKSASIAIGIDEHWMPRREGAPLPTTLAGTIVSLADKIDNLLGFFALGLKPTSSSDPYALRRQGIGLIRILVQNAISFPLNSVLSDCFKDFPQELQKSEGANLVTDIQAFLAQRARALFHDLGFPKGEIEACLTIRSDNFYDVYKRLLALNQFRKAHSSFNQLIEVHKRCQGQINGIARLPFSKEFLCEKEEKALFHAVDARVQLFLQSIKEHEYTKAFDLLAELQPHLAELFDKVKILSDDEKLKNNRIALLQSVGELFSQVADFQKIQEK